MELVDKPQWLRSGRDIVAECGGLRSLAALMTTMVVAAAVVLLVACPTEFIAVAVAVTVDLRVTYLDCLFISDGHSEGSRPV